MKKFLVLLAILMVSLAYGEYQIGDVCDNVEWTTTDGGSTSIYEQVDQGKAVMLFFGQSW